MGDVTDIHERLHQKRARDNYLRLCEVIERNHDAIAADPWPVIDHLGNYSSILRNGLEEIRAALSGTIMLYQDDNQPIEPADPQTEMYWRLQAINTILERVTKEINK